jgi:uncharacterized delta-60 repeat protein
LSIRRSNPILTLQRTLLLASSLFLLLAGTASAAAPGTPDSSFGRGGFAGSSTGSRLFAAAVQGDGKLVAAGQSTGGAGPDVLLARFTSSGALDPSFGHGGLASGPIISGAEDIYSLARAVAVQPDGKIVVVGKVTSSDGSGRDGILIERFNSNGTLDTGFGTGGVVVLFGTQFGDGYAVAVEAGGQIVATGSADAAGSGGTTPRVAVARLTSSGKPDASFGSGGTKVVDLGAYSYALAVALAKNGEIIISGSQAPGLQVPNALLAGFNSLGDLTFAYAHQYARGAASSAFNAVAVQPDGRIVAAGAATDGNSGADAIVARFTAGGVPDSSFGSGGVSYLTSAQNLIGTGNGVPGANGVSIAGNGDIIIAGTTADGLLTDGALWALTPSGGLDSRFGSRGESLINLGSNTNAELGGLALDANGNIDVAGDAGPPASKHYTGFVARFIGFPSPPPIVPGLNASLRTARRYKIAAARSHGLSFGVTCNQACSIAATLVAGAGAARQLRLTTAVRRCTRSRGHKVCRTTHVYRSVRIGKASGSLRGPGTKTLVLRLTRAASRALARQRRVTLALHVIVRSRVNSDSRSFSRTLTLTR